MGIKRNAYEILIERERPLWRFEHKREGSIKLGIREILYENLSCLKIVPSCNGAGDDKPSCLSLGQVSK